MIAFDESELKVRESLWLQGYWEVPDGLDTSNFDFDWRPFKFDRPYIHQFGTQHQKTGGPKFIIPNNEGVKYQDSQHAIRLSDKENRCWRALLPNSTMDFSWHPDETDPPFIYVFGNQWYDFDIMPTYQYRVKGATQKKYVTEICATLLPNKEDKSQGYWEVPDGLDITSFDFSWRPIRGDRPYIHQFGTQHQKTGGPRFVVPNNEGVKYQNFQHAIRLPNKENRCWRPLLPNATMDFSWHPDETEQPFIYVFGNQWHDSQVMPTYQYRVKGATQKKSITEISATLLPNKENRSWRPLKSNIEFDYSWVPHPYEPPFIYVFGNQWHDSQVMPTVEYRVKGATQKKYITEISATLLPNKDDRSWRPLKSNIEFDYSWVPNPHEPPFIYVFGNQWHISEKMPTVEYRVKDATTRKFLCAPTARFNTDWIEYDDSIFDKVMSTELTTEYTHFGNNKLNYDEIITTDNQYLQIFDNTDVVVPKQIKTFVYDKLTDYPHIKYHTSGYKHPPLDIVFLSNGEAKAEENYHHLLDVAKGLPNRIIGLTGIQGRVNSQHEAANTASTPWYFLINGKLKVNKDFDFSWQPTRLATRRHYIFTATNPLNGLEYGHQAIVANNKKLTLDTEGTGLDFTLDSPHESVNINSGIGSFNTSKWDTWRTAFREVIKLQHTVETIGDQTSKERLTTWLTVADGEFSDWCLKGAADAVEYYTAVSGDFAKLKLSYDWEWLFAYYTQKC